MATDLKKDFSIQVALDTTQIYTSTKEKELQGLLDKYKLKITPKVDFKEVDSLESRLKGLEKSQIINLKIDDDAAVKSVGNISSAITKSFNDSFSNNITKIVASSKALQNAFAGISGAAGSTQSALTAIDLLVGEKQNVRIDLFRKRIEALVNSFSSLGSSSGNFAELQTFATGIAGVISTIQTSFDNNKITPKFDFSARAIVGQFKQHKAEIQNLFLSDAEAKIELDAIPKFKTAVDEKGNQVSIKIPGTLDKAVTFTNIAKVIGSISTDLMSKKIGIKVPVDYQTIREDLSSFEIDLKFTERSMQNIRDVNRELFSINGLKFENLKAIKGVKLPSKDDKTILEALRQVLTEVNELKTTGIKLDDQAAINANKVANSVDAEAKAYEKKIASYEKAKKLYLDAYKDQLKYDSSDTSQNKQDVDKNVESAYTNLQEKLILLEKEEQDTLLKNLEIEKEIARTRQQNRADKALKTEKERLDQINNSARALNKQYQTIENTIHGKADTAHMKESDAYKEYLTLRAQFESEYAKLISKGASADQAQVHLDNLQSIKNRISDVVVEINKHSTANQNAAKDTDKLSRLHQELISYMNKYGSELKQNSDLYRKFVSLQNKMKYGNIGHVDAKAELATLRQEARLAGLEVDNVWKKLRRTFSARGRGWFSNQGWMLISNSLRDVWRNVVEIDTAMTELRKVTSATEQQYNQFLDGAKNRAQALGTTLADVVSSSSDFARLGYNIEDASTLADTALIYKNVGDDVDDIETASKSIISTMQGFNIEAENSMQIVDKFNEVANNYASSAGDIGEITKRSASAMKVAGADLDKTIALGVAANEVVQDADVVGTSLKTMSMRLRSSKSDLEAAGEDTDGMADSVSKLKDEIQALTGVNIMIDEDTFKDPYDMLMEIGKVWDDLSDISRANVGELLFGKRQTVYCLGAWKQAL